MHIALSAFLGRGSQRQTGRTASYQATLMRDTGEAAAVKVERLTLAPGDSLSVDPHSGGGFAAELKR